MQRRHILVAVPARNEADTIAVCIESIDVAARYVHARVTVVVAADSCTDATVTNARAVDITWCDLAVIEGTWGRAGATRAAAVGHGLTQLGVPSRSGWIANTDADCVVPPSWLRLQATMASSVDAIGCAARTATEVIDLHGRAVGPRALIQDESVIRRVGQLQLYVRQHHDGSDLEAIASVVHAP